MNKQLRPVDKKEYDQAYLKFHFDMICNKENWKYPIDCVIPTDKFEIFNQAVIHFTGGELNTIASTSSYARCEANGYYVDCGA